MADDPKSFKKQNDQVIKFLNDGIKLDVRELGGLADQSVDIIYKRVKSGLGVNNDEARFPSKKSLKDLAPSTIKARRRKGVKGKFGRPDKSNLTDTGQLLDAIKSMVLNDENYKVFIKNNPRRGSALTNKTVAEFVSKNGRPFFALTKDEQQILLKEIETVIRDKIRKFVIRK